MATCLNSTNHLEGAGSPSQDSTILDMVIPGFTVISSAIHSYSGIDINAYVPMLLILAGAWWLSGDVYQGARVVIARHFMCSACIRTDDEIFNMVMAWATKQEFSRNARSFFANTNVNSKYWLLWGSEKDIDGDGDGDEDDREGGADTWRKTVRCTPGYGKHYFTFKGRLFVFERSPKPENSNVASFHASDIEEIHISYFGRDPKVVKSLLSEIEAQHTNKHKSKTRIYCYDNGQAGRCQWRLLNTPPKRKMSTVILDPEVKAKVREDMEGYLSKDSEEWYRERGIPHKRNYLFYGPPGTGKTSLAVALAGHHNMSIHFLSLSSNTISEEELTLLASDLPKRSILLIEDIDCAKFTHSREPEKRTGEDRQPVPVKLDAGGLSLSIILNMLDGVASPNGSVLIMTTNHIEKLDAALKRCGRVDLRVELGFASRAVTFGLFKSICSPSQGTQTPTTDMEMGRSTMADGKYFSKVGIPKANQTSTNANAAQIAVPCHTIASGIKRPDSCSSSAVTMDTLAKEFSDNVPEYAFSPADIQNFLLGHKGNASAAIAGMSSWVEHARAQKARDSRNEVPNPDPEKENGGRQVQETDSCWFWRL